MPYLYLAIAVAAEVIGTTALQLHAANHSSSGRYPKDPTRTPLTNILTQPHITPKYVFLP